MQVIHYLNFTAQTFSTCADIFTAESTESAGLLRSLASARHIHAAQLWAIAGQFRDEKDVSKPRRFWPTWNFSAMPPAIGAGADITHAVEVLAATRETERALQVSPWSASWTNQHPTFNGIVNASKSVVMVLHRVLARLDKDEDKAWVCSNCMTFTPDKPDACPLCGVGGNWFKPSSRI